MMEVIIECELPPIIAAFAEYVREHTLPEWREGRKWWFEEQEANTVGWIDTGIRYVAQLSTTRQNHGELTLWFKAGTDLIVQYTSEDDVAADLGDPDIWELLGLWIEPPSSH
jgi:hypothetical protein